MSRTIFCVALIALSACASKRATNQPASPPGATTALGPVLARVSSINQEHRFVVLDFGARPLPATGTRLNVYRGDERIGAVELTGPVRGRFAVADILNGELRVGDEAR